VLLRVLSMLFFVSCNNLSTELREVSGEHFSKVFVRVVSVYSAENKLMSGGE